MTFLSVYARRGLALWVCGTATFIDGTDLARQS
jgi:hypothetical protein